MTKKLSNSKPTVFISFQHQSSNFVDSLEKKLSADAETLRFEDGVLAWGSFKEFMKSIRDQDFAVLVISEEYLQSEACMYEVVQLMQDANWKDKTMFAIMPNVALFDSKKRTSHIKFWNEKVKMMSDDIEGLPELSISAQREDLSRIKEIENSIGAFLSVVADRKNPPIYDVINVICERIKRAKKPILKLVENGRSVAFGEWYVRELLSEYDTVTARQIIEASGLSGSYISKLLRNLMMHGIIEATELTQDNKTTKYYSCVERNDEVG